MRCGDGHDAGELARDAGQRMIARLAMKVLMP